MSKIPTKQLSWQEVETGYWCECEPTMVITKTKFHKHDILARIQVLRPIEKKKNP